MADYYSKQRKKNITVGLFVVTGLVALVFMIFKFQDLPLWVTKSKSYPVRVQFPSAPGISKSTPIRFCGYEIGRVTRVSFPQLRENTETNQIYHQALVHLAIDKKYKDIPSNVEIKIMKRGLGSSYVEMKVDPGLEPVPIDPNRPETAFLGPDLPVLQGETGQASEFFPEETQKKADDLINQFTALLTNANEVIGDANNQTSIQKLLKNTEIATAQATETLKEIKNFSSSGEKLFNNANTEMSRVADTLHEAGFEFASALKKLQITLDKANSGDGTAAKILNDGRLYENLLDSSQELRLALEQMRKLVTQARDNGVPIKLK